ncbi:hypothetical protein SLA2020_139580 [Shorea laevis]
MATPKIITFLLIISIIYFAGKVESASRTRSSATNFIKVQCSTTQYPAQCVQSLSVYASVIQQSPRKLAETALSVSLARAQSAKVFVSKMGKFRGLKSREYKAIGDCIEEMGDSIDRLSKSIREMKRVGKGKGRELQWHISNMQTWVSAALTDENTCVDGFAGRALDGKIKSSVRARVVNVAQVTSNGLALINRFASKL